MKSSLRSLLRKAGRIMWIAAIILLAAVVLLAGLLLAMSPGKPAQYLDANGQPLANSLSEKMRVNINGVEQGMFIKSRNVDNPVLLFVHGGPGMPEYWLTRWYPTGLEEYFTVVWWEQRGAGLSYSPDIPPESMTAEQFIADTRAVTEYLRQRFGREKITLMAHSWGSYIGIQAAARYPELYTAYIGIGQISHQVESEQLAYAYALDFYKKAGDQKMVQKLEAAPPTLTVPLPAAYMSLRDPYMHGASIGTTRQMKSVVSGLFLPSFQFPEYTLAEKINLWRGKFYSRSSDFSLWDKMQATDLADVVTELALPVYFLEGRYDYTCAYPLARDYFDQLEAPVKGFYTFENSAHSPMFEEPQRTVEILLTDVLAGSNSLADR
jgi:pimeloyl-ACP methyl ester carboxylesterase